MLDAFKWTYEHVHMQLGKVISRKQFHPDDYSSNQQNKPALSIIWSCRVILNMKNAPKKTTQGKKWEKEELYMFRKMKACPKERLEMGT